MNAIEETIERVEQLYCTLTGHRPPQPNGHSMRIPPEIDPGRHVEDQLAKLIAAIDQVVPGGAPVASPMPAWTPPASVWRDEAGLHLAIDVPGVARDAIELRLAGRSLVVRGHRAPAWGDARTGRAIEGSDAAAGPFLRTFELAGRVEPDQLTARLDAGVLHVLITRAPAREPSPVPIQS